MRFLIMLFILALPGLLFPETIFFNDGTRLDGDITQVTPDTITIKTSNMILTINRDKIMQGDIPMPPPASRPSSLMFEKTTFEQAEQLYHEGKIVQSLPLYEKAYEQDPSNQEAAVRIREIKEKFAARIKRDIIRPITPLTEEEVILNVVKRQQERRAVSRPAVSSPPALSGPFDTGTPGNIRSPFSTPSRPTGNTPTQARSLPPFSPQTQSSKPPLINPPPGPATGKTSLPPMISQQTSSPFHVTPRTQKAPETRDPFHSPFGTVTEKPRQQIREVMPQPPMTAQPETKPGVDPFHSPFRQITKPESPQPGTQSLPPMEVKPSTSPFPDTGQSVPSPFAISEKTETAPFRMVQSRPEETPAMESPFRKVKKTFPESVPVTTTSGGEPDKEFRGVWISRFEWPSRDPVSCKQRILRHLDNIVQGNFNAVIFQVRGQGDTLYPSPYEPWSPLIGGADPGFDPLQFTLDEAHARELELHAYVNPYPVWHGANPPPHSTPEHPYWLYCQPDSEPNLVCFDKSGQIMKPSRDNDNYVYFSPGNPAVSAYIRKIVMDIVQRYDVDGIHFDRIRYPGGNYSHDKVSLARFKGDGNPLNLSWEDWQCDQITRFLNDVYGEVSSVKPEVKISVAGWGIYNKNRYPGYERFSSGIHQYYQDTFAWLEKGVIDALIPMIYWDIKDPKPNYDDLAGDFLENAAGRHVYCANWTNQKNMAPEEFQAQIRLSRQLGGVGNVAFSAGGLERRNLAPYYSKQIYTKTVPTPDMPWKTNSSKGMLIGRVSRKDNGKPIVDAHIKIPGREDVALSSTDGFFAILHLDPGDYQLVVTKNGFGQVSTDPVSLQAGQVLNVDVSLGG